MLLGSIVIAFFSLSLYFFRSTSLEELPSFISLLGLHPNLPLGLLQIIVGILVLLLSCWWWLSRLQVVSTLFRDHSVIKCGKLNCCYAFITEIMGTSSGSFLLPPLARLYFLSWPFILLVLGWDHGLSREACSSDSQD